MMTLKTTLNTVMTLTALGEDLLMTPVTIHEDDLTIHAMILDKLLMTYHHDTNTSCDDTGDLWETNRV